VTESSKAVFLSYAAQDAATAKRICEALRAAGIEVWFDQTELRGGDAWDAKIRQQIRSCALFIPLISDHTRLRGEGYFRLEWKLAVDRSHLLAADEPFLLPVALDETREGDARVPDRFLETQWIRAPGGNLPPEFTPRVQALLKHDTRRKAEVTAALAHGQPPGSRRHGLAGSVLAMALTCLVLAAGAVAAWRYFHDTSYPAAYSSEDRRMTFAFIPLTAPPADAQADDVAKTTSARIQRELEDNTAWAHTVSAPQVLSAIPRATDARSLARLLNVHFLVRGALIRQSDGYLVKLYTIDGDTERALGDTSFKIPAGALAPRWRDDIADPLSVNIYYGLVAEVQRARSKPDAALDVRDLSFRAFYDWGQSFGHDPKAGYADAGALLKRALALAPDDRLALALTAEINLCDCIEAWSKHPEEQRALGAAAVEHYLLVNPPTESMLSYKGMLFSLDGRWEEALAMADAILRKNPESSDGLELKVKSLLKLGRPREALPIADGLMDRGTESEWIPALAAATHFAVADYEAAARLARNAASQLSAGQAKSPARGDVRLTLAAAEAELDHADRAAQALADFRASVPGVASIAQIRAWLRPTSLLSGFEPLYAGLRRAGVSD